MNLKSLFDLFSVDRYYKMSNKDLQNEAAKYHIGGYVVPFGPVNITDRQVIIDALIKKDGANSSRIAIFLSAAALIISIIAIVFK